MTYATLLTATRLSGLGLFLGCGLGLLLGGLRLGLLLGRLGLLFLLRRLWFRLVLWLRLFLLALGLRRSLLVLGCSLLGLVLGLLLLSTSRGTAGLDLDEVLADGDCVLLADEELLDGAGLGCVDGDVDLVGFDGRNLLVLLNVVADLCMTLVGRGRVLVVTTTHVLTIASKFPL
jgi:hypothetical protein